MTLDNALAVASDPASPRPLYLQAGTYPCAADYALTASKALYGGFAGTETTAAQRTGTPGVDNVTTLDALDTTEGIFSYSAAGLSLTLNRLTLTRSARVAIYVGSRPVPPATAYTARTGNLTVTDCILSANRSPLRAGIEATNTSCVVNITNSQFLDNIGNYNTTVVGSSAGFAVILNGTGAIKNCVFKNNSNALNRGTVQFANFRGLVDSCWFEGNSATDGGAIQNWSTSFVGVRNCVFKNNTASGNGGAIWVRNSTTYIVNSTFVGNVNNGASPSDGIMMAAAAKDQYIANNIFTGHGDNAVGTDYGDPDKPRIVMKNNLLEAGGAGNVNGVAEGITNTGVVTAAPLLVSATDFHLQAGSPAINAGMTDPYTVPGTTLVVLYPSRDYAGLVRFAGPDLGAYEIAVTGPLTITPDPLNFGVVVKETTSTKTLTLANTAGNLPITISAITPAGATQFSLVDPPTPPVTLLAGESLDIGVTFTAPLVTARVPYAGTLTVANTGAVTPVIVSLNAIAAPSLFPGEPPTVLVERSAGTPATTKVFPIEFNITFSEGVTGFELSDVYWGGSVPAGNVTATLIPREATGALYTLRITAITGASGTISPVVPAGVCETIGGYANLASNTDAVVNYGATLFGAVIATTASDITGAGSVTCTVTFDAAVKAVDARALIELKLGLAGTSAGASIASVLEANPSTAYTVEITTGGDGTLALTLTDDDTILKASTDAPLNGPNAGDPELIYGPTIEVDKTAPTVVSVQRAFGATRGTNAETVTFRVTFSDIVTGVDVSDFAIACNDATADVASVAAVGNTALVVCNVKAAVGTYALSVKTAATMTNRVGLAYATGTPDPNEDYFIFTQAPPPTSVGTWTLY
jgi:predicted outer membrane repeat protein